MQFFYHEEAGRPRLNVDSNGAHYLFRVRRLRPGMLLDFCNLKDGLRHAYKHEGKNEFSLVASSVCKAAPPRLSLIMAVVDPKDIYDSLPMLNALNAASLSLFYADRSQKNRQLDMGRAGRILQSSCMQCGRPSLMKLALYENLDEVLGEFPKASFIDFASPSAPSLYLENLDKDSLGRHASLGLVIGPEGGFSQLERRRMDGYERLCLKAPYILTSQAAGVYVASLCAALDP